MKNRISYILFFSVVVLCSLSFIVYAWLSMNNKVVSDGVDMDIDTSEQDGSGFNIKDGSLNINGTNVLSNEITIYPGDTFSYIATTSNNVDGFYISILENKKSKAEFENYFKDKSDLLLGLYSENINGNYYDFDVETISEETSKLDFFYEFYKNNFFAEFIVITITAINDSSSVDYEFKIETDQDGKPILIDGAYCFKSVNSFVWDVNTEVKVEIKYAHDDIDRKPLYENYRLENFNCFINSSITIGFKKMTIGKE